MSLPLVMESGGCPGRGLGDFINQAANKDGTRLIKKRTSRVYTAQIKVCFHMEMQDFDAFSKKLKHC